MTVCVGVAVHDCLVFAADSASTLVGTDPVTGESRVLNVYRHGNKVFNLHKKLPVCAMTCGMGNIGVSSIATLAKDLRLRLTSGGTQWKLDPKAYTVEDIAQHARRFLFEETFAALNPPPPAPHSLEFWVGGYGSDRSCGHDVWKIEIVNGQCAPPAAVVTGGATGLFAGGQTDPLDRLIGGFDKSVYEVLISAGMNAANATALTNYLRGKLGAQVLAPTMPVQDAIELADFLTGTCKSYYRFLPGADIVGGDTDIAVVTRYEGFKWIKRKHYYPAELNRLETDHAK
jgi:hypothetical protein